MPDDARYKHVSCTDMTQGHETESVTCSSQGPDIANLYITALFNIARKQPLLPVS
jgi:hypothetical protein